MRGCAAASPPASNNSSANAAVKSTSTIDSIVCACSSITESLLQATSYERHCCLLRCLTWRPAGFWPKQNKQNFAAISCTTAGFDFRSRCYAANNWTWCFCKPNICLCTFAINCGVLHFAGEHLLIGHSSSNATTQLTAAKTQPIGLR